MFCNVGPLLYNGLLVKRFLSFVFFFFFLIEQIAYRVYDNSEFKLVWKTRKNDSSQRYVDKRNLAFPFFAIVQFLSFVAFHLTKWSKWIVRNTMWKKVSFAYIAIIYSQYGEFNSCIFGQSYVIEQLAYGIDACMEVSIYYAYAIVKDSKRRETNRQWWDIMEEYIYIDRKEDRDREVRWFVRNLLYIVWHE